LDPLAYVIEPASEHAARPRILLLGDAYARPVGLERALTRAGFQLIEREGSEPQACADAILVTVSTLDAPQLAELLPQVSPENHAGPPRVVLIAGADPEAPGAALALGAADALGAPIHLPELCARIHARIREHSRLSNPPDRGVVPAGSTSVLSPNGRQRETFAVGTSQDKPVEVLERRLQEEFERARRYSLSFSLILLGIDALQDSNERMGAEATAQLRAEVGEALREGLRLPDLVAPYGPDEFAILLPETGQAGARDSVVRVRELLTSLPFEGDPRLDDSRFSAGIVTFPHPAVFQADDLFALAAAALMRGRAQSIERIGVAV
jgi:two-component system cell cycle response regulator